MVVVVVVVVEWLLDPDPGSVLGDRACDWDRDRSETERLLHFGVGNPDERNNHRLFKDKERCPPWSLQLPDLDHLQ